MVQDEEAVESRSPWPIILILGLIFLPGGILAFLLYGVLRYGKQRPSTVALIASVISFIAIVVGYFSIQGVLSGGSEVIKTQSVNGLGGILESIIPLWFSVSLILGSIAGWGFSVYSARQMKKSPHLTEIEGNWQYNFQYKRTPREYFERKKRIRELKNGLLISEHKAPMGLDEKTDEVVFRYDSEARKHTFMTGASGSGKTITMQNLIYSDIEVGKTVVVVDFKRSPKFASKLAAFAEENGREFFHFVNGDPKKYDIPLSKGQCYYDPLKSGTPTSKADMVLGMREYDSNAAVYKTAMQQLLQVLFGMTTYADRTLTPNVDWNHGGIFQLASIVSGNGLGQLAAANTVQVQPGSSNFTYELPGGGGITGSKEVYVNSPLAKQATELVEALKTKSPLTQAQGELQGQMRTILASEYGRWMKTGSNPEDREIDLYEQTSKDGNVILFSLNSDSEPEFAQYIGSMIFSDLTNISALRRNSGAENQVNIYVDEFQAVPPTSVTSLLEKSRESKMALTLALQSFEQVIAAAENTGEAYLLSIIDTCSNFIAHAGAAEKSAIRLSEILGKHFETVHSRSNDNDSSFLSVNWSKNKTSKITSHQEERWIFPPSEFMSLSIPDDANGNKSSAVWVTKASADPKYSKKGGPSARTVWMIPADPVTVEYYFGSEKESDEDEPVSLQRIEPEAPKVYQQLAPANEVVEDDSSEIEDDWSYEDISDEEIDSTEATAFLPEVAPEPYDLNDLFNSNAAPNSRTEEKKTETTSLPKKAEMPPQRKGLPTQPPSRGLPTHRPAPISSESLPDLD